MTDSTPPTPPDQPPTEEAPTQGLAPEPRSGRRLLRSRDDRMLAGVAGGLGDYFEVDPLIIRIGFAVSVFFGGLGILAYLALALFVPSMGAEPGAPPEPAPVQRRRWLGIAAAAVLVIAVVSAAGSLFFWADPWPWDGGGWGVGWLFFVAAVGAAVYFAVNRSEDRGEDGAAADRSQAARLFSVAGLAIVAVFGLGAIAVVSAWVGAVGSGAVIAGVVAAIGILLLVAAFFGGARWLIAPALALAVPLAVVSAADVSFAGGVGEREYSPASEAAVPADGYELGVGRLEVDLRTLDWERDEIVDLDVDLGVGDAVVVVPSDVCIEGRLEAGVGEVRAGGESSDGFEPVTELDHGSTATPRLLIDGEVDLGALRVLADDDVDLDDHHWDRDDEDDEQARAAAAAACAR